MKFPSKKSVGAYVYLLQEWYFGAPKIQMIALDLSFDFSIFQVTFHWITLETNLIILFLSLAYEETISKKYLYIHQRKIV